MTINFYVLVDGEKLPVYRDVCHNHDERIHAALGTATEIELQQSLDAVNVHDWFDGDDYKGEDCNGLGVEINE